MGRTTETRVICERKGKCFARGDFNHVCKILIADPEPDARCPFMKPDMEITDETEYSYRDVKELVTRPPKVKLKKMNMDELKAEYDRTVRALRRKRKDEQEHS